MAELDEHTPFDPSIGDVAGPPTVPIPEDLAELDTAPPAFEEPPDPAVSNPALAVRLEAAARSVRLLDSLGASRETTIARLAAVDRRIDEAALEAARNGLTWPEIWEALSASSKVEALPTQEQLYRRTRTSITDF